MTKKIYTAPKTEIVSAELGNAVLLATSVNTTVSSFDGDNNEPQQDMPVIENTSENQNNDNNFGNNNGWGRGW